MVSYVIATTVEVDPAEARVSQVIPVEANPAETEDVVNGGTYAWRALILGLGVSYTFDAPRRVSDETEMTAPPAALPPSEKSPAEDEDEEEAPAEEEDAEGA